MNPSDINYDNLRDLTIGTVESVSPREIRVLLDLNAPQNTALNTGTPTLFPKINGYVLIPNEAGALIGMISWIWIEHSPYPKRKGFKDFGLIDLPFPLRKMTISPLGILKKDDSEYRIERGVYSYPSVGDAVVIPTHKQLQSIVENKGKNAKIKIGNSPLAANAPVYVDPDKLFGRHVAVLGNTGSGKSCSVAGLIRWSLESAIKEIGTRSPPNARFIILDPNGEYTNTFDKQSGKEQIFKVRKFEVAINGNKSRFSQLRVPAWMWNSYEWSSITQASGRTQRPLLRRALRELRSGNIGANEDQLLSIRRFYSSCLIEIKQDYQRGASAFKGKPGKNEFGKKLQSIANDAQIDSQKPLSVPELMTKLSELSTQLENIASRKHASFRNSDGETIEYYNDFEKANVEHAIDLIEVFLSNFGGASLYKGPDEDSPVYFKDEDLPNHLV